MAFVWSNEAIERLRALHAQGLSGAELASRLGGGLTRSAVFGKLHRLGLTGKRNEASRRTTPPRGFGDAASGPCACGGAARSLAARGTGPMKFNFARKGVQGARASAGRGPGTVLPPPPPLRIGIVEIGEGQCRFIEGDDGLACGHPVAKDSRWCPAHLAIVFVVEAA